MAHINSDSDFKPLSYLYFEFGLTSWAENNLSDFRNFAFSMEISSACLLETRLKLMLDYAATVDIVLLSFGDGALFFDD